MGTQIVFAPTPWIIVLHRDTSEAPSEAPRLTVTDDLARLWSLSFDTGVRYDLRLCIQRQRGDNFTARLERFMNIITERTTHIDCVVTHGAANPLKMTITTSSSYYEFSVHAVIGTEERRKYFAPMLHWLCDDAEKRKKAETDIITLHANIESLRMKLGTMSEAIAQEQTEQFHAFVKLLNAKKIEIARLRRVHDLL